MVNLIDRILLEIGLEKEIEDGQPLSFELKSIEEIKKMIVGSSFKNSPC